MIKCHNTSCICKKNNSKPSSKDDLMSVHMPEYMMFQLGVINEIVKETATPGGSSFKFSLFDRPDANFAFIYNKIKGHTLNLLNGSESDWKYLKTLKSELVKRNVTIPTLHADKYTTSDGTIENNVTDSEEFIPADNKVEEPTTAPSYCYSPQLLINRVLETTGFGGSSFKFSIMGRRGAEYEFVCDKARGHTLTLLNGSEDDFNYLKTLKGELASCGVRIPTLHAVKYTTSYGGTASNVTESDGVVYSFYPRVQNTSNSVFSAYASAQAAPNFSPIPVARQRLDEVKAAPPRSIGLLDKTSENVQSREKTVTDTNCKNLQAIGSIKLVKSDVEVVDITVPSYSNCVITLTDSHVKELNIEDLASSIDTSRNGTHTVTAIPASFNYPYEGMRGVPPEGAFGRIKGKPYKYENGQYIEGVEVVIIGKIPGKINFKNCIGRIVIREMK